MSEQNKTPKNLQDILAIEDIPVKISYLKKGRRRPEPKVDFLKEDWEPTRHEIMDSKKVGKVRVLKKLAYDEYDKNGSLSMHHEAEYEEKDPNRIALGVLTITDTVGGYTIVCTGVSLQKAPDRVFDRTAGNVAYTFLAATISEQ